MAKVDPACGPSSAPMPTDQTRATTLKSLRWDGLERAAPSVQITPFVLRPRDSVRDRTASPRLESGTVAPSGPKAELVTLRPLTPPPRPMRKSAAALGLVRKDPEGAITRNFSGKEGKEPDKTSEGEDDFDGQQTLARRPNEDEPEPETLARAIDEGETFTRPRSKVDVDESDETLPKPRSDDPETVPRSRTGAIDPTPPPAPAIRTPLAMVIGPEDNLTRVAPVSPPASPRLQAPSNPGPFPQVAPSSPQLALSGPLPLPSGAQLPQAGTQLPEGVQPPQSRGEPAPSSSPVPLQRAVIFVVATLLVAAVVFFVLRPRSSLMSSAAAAEPPPTPVAVEQLPPPAVKAPPVATVIAPPDLPNAPAPPPTATTTATATSKASAATATSTALHGAHKRKHVYKHRIPIRREQ